MAMASPRDLSRLSRRAVLKGWLASSSAVLGSAILGPALLAPVAQASDATMPTTPACGADSGPTRSSTEGPFYSENPPEKHDFRADAPGIPVTLIGYVLTQDCQPVADAMVDLWHANQDGDYDNRGFKLRGYQKTDAQGRYYFETIRPAEYGGRTPHYHIKIHPPQGAALTTQLYFPGEPRNSHDFLFNQALLLKIETAHDGDIARFDFVLA